jgi:phosphatidylserine/phosphatidylglycerophosphate/cardiolipin synthase-like enzyme
MKPILEVGRNCDRIAPVDASGVLIDARDYYLAVHAAILSAQHHVAMLGWQFDSGVPLVRGEDLARATGPARLLELIEHAAAARPELRFYLLAWDYSLVFALEREWMQRLKFDWSTNERIRFAFDDQHPVGASHHQKLVIVDGAIAFAGGIDLCESRWDDRRHALGNSDRVRRKGDPQKPYHDLMAYCTGPAVGELAGLFCERWRRATGERLQLAPRSADAALPPELPGALAIEAERVAISTTFGAHERSDTPRIEQIKRLHEDAIASAARLIYIETQYFTARAVHAALCARMKAPGPRLEIAIVMPKGADTPKENFALGGAQDWVLSSLAVTAAEHGHELIVLFSAAQDDAGELVATFIHSKLLAVDDRLLTVGSANCTNRSMSFDSELNLAWESSAPGDAVARGIARVRASLLCEHAGIDFDPSLAVTTGLVSRLDALCGPTKLRRRDLHSSPEHVEQDPLLERAFDPEEDLTALELGELLEPRRD